MTLFDNQKEIDELLTGDPPEMITGICQGCKAIAEIPMGTPTTCTLHEQPMPILTVFDLFRALYQIETVLKQGPDEGVKKHHEIVMELMDMLQTAILEESEEK